MRERKTQWKEKMEQRQQYTIWVKRAEGMRIHLQQPHRFPHPLGFVKLTSHFDTYWIPVVTLQLPCLFLFFRRVLFNPSEEGSSPSTDGGHSIGNEPYLETPPREELLQFVLCPLWAPELSFKQQEVGGSGGAGECGQTSSTPLLCNVWNGLLTIH